MARRRPHRGFTLIEAVACVVLLAVLIPPTMWAMRESHQQRVNPMLASRARWLATEKLEDVIADRHSTTRGYGYLISSNYAAESSITGFPGFTRSVAFVVTAADLVSPGTGYKRVTVTVNWTDAAGTARSLAIATVVTDYT
jgi:prepilin-type N-terminal cleavage/methylation domain-containing protein